MHILIHAIYTYLAICKIIRLFLEEGTEKASNYFNLIRTQAWDMGGMGG